MLYLGYAGATLMEHNVESYCSTQPPPCSELNPTSPKGCLQLHCQRASVLLASSLPPIAVLSACFPVGKPRASYLSPARKETFSLHFSFICTQQEVPTSTIQDDELNSFQGSCGYNTNDPMCTVTHFWLICNSSRKNVEWRGEKKITILTIRYELPWEGLAFCKYSFLLKAYPRAEFSSEMKWFY